MSECKGCKFSKDMNGCASHHADTALKMLAEGKIEEAQKNLEGLKAHTTE